MRRELPIGSSDVWLAIATTTFDASLLELLLILAIGGRLVIADEAMTRDGRLLAARLGRGDITVMQATPATWQMLIDSGWRGSARFTALSGGEALHRPLADALLDRVSTLWNEYGPTEATINATCARVERVPDPVSIGSPIANTACYVLDESGTPVAVGVPGALVIGGRGIARGYRNDPERTAARFVPDPFDTSGKGICFRTGDFVRVSESGSLIYLGRRDQQVKIRGFRVELGDIEAALAAHPAVRSAVAVVHGSDIASRRIAAYVVLDPAAACEERHLKAHLHALLPSYMVPATLTIEDALPRLPSGKLDRGALARCTPICEPAKPVTPSNPIEEKLLSILKDVLGIDHAGLDEDFFALGGTSLLGLRYIVRACEVFGVDLGTAELMHTPTVRGLAQRIAAGQLLSSPHASAGDAEVTTPLACNMWRPLALARAEGAFEKIDSAAITYLPDELLSTQGFHRLRGAPEGRAAGPHWMGACRTQIGTIALLVAPLTARDLIGGSSAAKSTLDTAVAYAARLGAHCISLTGLIPAATNLGRDLACPDHVALTTGHACTASAMALTIQSAAAATGRDLEEETLSFVGLGAIGSATLRVLLECVAHPRALILCDLPGNLGHLQLLAREARTTLGFQGSIKVVTATTSLPKQIYDSDFLIAATNAPNSIEVERLRPGTIVVDYSFPSSFDFDQAMHRFADAGDILVATGGSIGLQESMDWTFMLPPELTAFTQNDCMSSIFPPPDSDHGMHPIVSSSDRRRSCCNTRRGYDRGVPGPLERDGNPWHRCSPPTLRLLDPQPRRHHAIPSDRRKTDLRAERLWTEGARSQGLGRVAGEEQRGKEAQIVMCVTGAVRRCKSRRATTSHPAAPGVSRRGICGEWRQYRRASAAASTPCPAWFAR
jgi:predicted amino acid dehydrogenase